VATLAPGLDPALAGAIDRALRRDPAERLASAEAMAEVLRAAPATAAIVAVPRRRRALALGAGGVVAAVAVAVAALTLRGGGEAARPTPAISPAAAAASTALAVQGRALASGAGCARTPVFVDDDRLAYALVDTTPATCTCATSRPAPSAR
jgi:hypothetical protein